ncbi:MAG: type II toxin-antitoxin system RelE/ParE family toxin [Clostridiales Family XIII bacterium]|nr:type II toxin-antitoxin system RelE/ParE family toxin [Clostridiales Family XIII bacterium]
MYFSPAASKELDRLDKPTRIRILQWVQKNLVGCDDPRRIGKALSGQMSRGWSYRVGAYRLIADINDPDIFIDIIKIGHRREVYL